MLLDLFDADGRVLEVGPAVVHVGEPMRSEIVAAGESPVAEHAGVHVLRGEGEPVRLEHLPVAVGFVVPGQMFVPVESLFANVALVWLLCVFFDEVHGAFEPLDPLAARILVVAGVLLFETLSRCFVAFDSIS